MKAITAVGHPNNLPQQIALGQYLSTYDDTKSFEEILNDVDTCDDSIGAWYPFEDMLGSEIKTHIENLYTSLNELIQHTYLCAKK